MKNRKTKKGFTIVELVIVIAVIGILSAILIPTFVNLTANAQKAALKQELADAYAAYVADVADGYIGGDATDGVKVDTVYTQAQVAVAKKTGAVYTETVFYTYSNGWTDEAAALASAVTEIKKGENPIAFNTNYYLYVK